MGRNIFITGASGFLGKALVNSMLELDHEKFYFLVRSPGSQRVIEDEFKRASRDRLHFVKGDIELPFAGISTDDLGHLSKSIDEVWHMAASTSFDDAKKREIEIANVDGTRNMVKVASEFSRLKAFNYISTAYVCGKQQGVVSEDRLQDNAGFKNHYELTKLTAENLVRDSGLPFTVIRPSIIMGDSRTGDARGENRMIYGYLLALYNSALHHSAFRGEMAFRQYWNQRDGDPSTFQDVDARLFGFPNVTKNLVTLDDVVKVCVAINQLPYEQRVGKTYNLVNEGQLTSGFIIESMQKALKIKGFRYDPDFNPRESKQSNVERAGAKYTRPFFPYARITEPHWEHGNVDSACKAQGAERVVMTPALFDRMMRLYVEKELMSVGGV